MAEGGRQALGPGAAFGGHVAADESSYLVGIGHFSEWLAEHAPEVSMPAALARAVLEDYMLWVRHELPWKPATRNQRLLAVRMLLEEQREDGLAGLPAGAVIHGAELPRVDPGLPKTLPGAVFAQWIEPANLALLNERDRTIVLVLAFRGFRVSSVVTPKSFHAVHQQHQAETRRLLDKARKNNNGRLIEVLERDEHSLSRILEGLDAIEADHASSEEIDLRELAAPDQPEGR